MTDPYETATSLAGRLARGEVSAEEVTEASLARIAELDGDLNAFLTVDVEGARARARDLDQQRAGGASCGPLHGLPVAIKDVTATAGLRTTEGSVLFAHHVPQVDAESVARLRRAGAVILGKTNTPEFAFGAVCINRLCGPTRNPWDRSRTSGGSSGGSAVAVATGMVPLAQGTDFGGSVRMPASFCGLFGLRPTPGIIAEPERKLGWSALSTQGVLARTPDDAALMLGVMAGSHPGDPLSQRAPDLNAEPPDRLRVASSLDLGGAFPVDPEVAIAFAGALEALEDIVGPIAQVAPPTDGAVGAFKALRAAESWYRSGALVEEHEADLMPSFVWNVRQGRDLSAADMLAADAMRTRTWRDFMKFFAEHDVLVMPTCAVLPFLNSQEEVLEVGGRRLDTIIDYLACTFIISLVGFPALSVPAPRTKGELPFGLQLVVAPGREAFLLRVAGMLERSGFRFEIPPVDF